MLTTAAGVHTNAVYGFLNILFKCIDDERADYLLTVVNSTVPGTVVPGDTEIALEDHILTLSTCVDELPENRRLVLALLTETINEGKAEDT